MGFAPSRARARAPALPWVLLHRMLSVRFCDDHGPVRRHCCFLFPCSFFSLIFYLALQAAFGLAILDFGLGWLVALILTVFYLCLLVLSSWK